MANLLRVLIVEDNDDDRQLVAAALADGGYDLVRGLWDLVISDYAMPGFCGIEALHILQERGLDLPFIIVSGKIGEATAMEMMKCGAHDCVSKDDLGRLLPAVEHELREAAARRERRLAEEAGRQNAGGIEQRRTAGIQQASGQGPGRVDGARRPADAGRDSVAVQGPCAGRGIDRKDPRLRSKRRSPAQHPRAIDERHLTGRRATTLDRDPLGLPVAAIARIAGISPAFSRLGS